jgi:putative DNA primase/helicase
MTWSPFSLRSPVEHVLDRLPSKPRRSGRGWTARCPAHEDRTPSLSITETADGKVLMKCWAGCSTESVLAALGLRWSDLFPGRTDGGRRSDGR